MNWEHLKTFLWLRWRLTANLNKRQGLLVTILVYLLLVFFALGGLAALAAGFLFGNIKMASLPAHEILTTWEMMVLLYLIFWMTGLMAELQRSDILSLDKFLPLPVSPAGAFLINYLGSSISLTLVIFLSLMSGITIGLLVSLGIKMFMLVLLVASFFLMVTAVTYQFRGWLASMMTTPKRRQAVLGILGIVFFIIFMSPSLTVVYQKATGQRRQVDATAVTAEQGGENSGATASSREIERFRSPMVLPDRALLQARFQLVNYIFPPGWLPVGAVYTLEGRYFSAIVTMLGMLLIGIWSLMRSYRTTIRMYKGEFDSRPVPVRPVSSATAGEQNGEPGKHASFLEIRLPWVSEHASVIALASLRAKLRSNAVKFMLILPLLLLVLFGGFLGNRLSGQSEFIRPLMAAGVAAFILFASMTYVVGNLFAYDRGGFRVYVLSSTKRRDVLLGKNLSLFPFAFSIMLFSILVVNWFQPLRPDHLLAAILQAVPLYLILCMYGNQLSILMPMIVRQNGMPASGQNVNILVRELTGLIMLAVLTVTFIPLGIEYLMYLLDWHTWFPAYLIFMLVETGLVILGYSVILNHQADSLYRREQRILEVVTARVD